jgi:hypothetical protein
MQSKDEKKKLFVFTAFFISILLINISVIKIGSCNEETSVDVKFEILTGLGIESYYSGDHFWYNITLTNSGTTTINASFTVTVRNTTGGIIGDVGSYKRHLEPTDTTILYPNYTRLGKEEVNVYFIDIAGTYSITLTSDIPMNFYRYYETGRYTVEHDKCHINIDVMPSYMKPQNERWNEFLQKNEEYMNQVQQYIEESKIASQKTAMLGQLSISIASLAIFLSVGNIYLSWWKLNKKIQNEKRRFFYVMNVGIFVLLGLLLYQGLLISGLI